MQANSNRKIINDLFKLNESLDKTSSTEKRKALINQTLSKLKK